MFASSMYPDWAISSISEDPILLCIYVVHLSRYVNFSTWLFGHYLCKTHLRESILNIYLISLITRSNRPKTSLKSHCLHSSWTKLVWIFYFWCRIYMSVLLIYFQSEKWKTKRESTTNWIRLIQKFLLFFLSPFWFVQEENFSSDRKT